MPRQWNGNQLLENTRKEVECQAWTINHADGTLHFCSGEYFNSAGGRTFENGGYPAFDNEAVYLRAKVPAPVKKKKK
jgi:hypothetical protein